MAKYLVTGGAGFIGSHLMEALLDRGHDVVCLDNFDDFYPRERKEANLRQATQKGPVAFVEGDIRDTNTVAAVFRDHRPQYVVHLAARAGVRPSIQSPMEYLTVNVAGTLNLLQAASEAGVRKFVFGSSSSVYGAANTLPFAEDQDVTRPISPYAASKISCETYCHTYHHLTGMPVVNLRFFTVFGPRQRPDLAINKFVRLMLADESIPVFGDGSTSRDYTFVADIVRGIIAAAESDIAYDVINLGGSSPVTLSGLIEALEQATGRNAKIQRLPNQPGDVPHTYADVSKAARLLGWQPEISLLEGLRRFVEWYREAQ